MNHRALVLFSGGQDSATCLAWALARYAHVETIGFDYGQRHRVELQCRLTVLDGLRSAYPAWAARLGADHVIDLAVLGRISDTAMTQDRAIEMQANGLPNTFVPGRNLLFFTFAATVAYRRGLQVLVGGMCETDYSGYPDCRDNTLKALQLALSLGMDTPMVVETPLMWLDKAASSGCRLTHRSQQTRRIKAQRRQPHGQRRPCGGRQARLPRQHPQVFARRLADDGQLVGLVQLHHPVRTPHLRQP
jgi:7-cyano-7-deazaguanine synthase